ncbi:hypothetical protein BDV32DRAFT_126813 [Aspergillus pseudonomiae]|nr:hypothetical protein BDV32DRAFT_126813 [Aspergillus pseudonomiae]
MHTHTPHSNASDTAAANFLPTHSRNGRRRNWTQRHANDITLVRAGKRVWPIRCEKRALPLQRLVLFAGACLLVFGCQAVSGSR